MIKIFIKKYFLAICKKIINQIEGNIPLKLLIKKILANHPSLKMKLASMAKNHNDDIYIEGVKIDLSMNNCTIITRQIYLDLKRKITSK